MSEFIDNKMADNPDDKKKGGGLFGGSGSGKKPGSINLFGGKPKEDPNIQEAIANISTQLNDISRRLRVLEERNNNLNKKIQVTEQNILTENKKVNLEIKTTNSEITDFKKKIYELNSKTELIVKELKLCAKKEDVDTLNKYINLWDPVKFVTQNDVINIVNEIIEENTNE